MRSCLIKSSYYLSAVLFMSILICKRWLTPSPLGPQGMRGTLPEWVDNAMFIAVNAIAMIFMIYALSYDLIKMYKYNNSLDLGVTFSFQFYEFAKREMIVPTCMGMFTMLVCWYGFTIVIIFWLFMLGHLCFPMKGLT